MARTHTNTPKARATMIDMICDPNNATLSDQALLAQVNSAIAGDGSSIELSSLQWIKEQCKWFKKYPQLEAAHIQHPYTWTDFERKVNCLEQGRTNCLP